MGRSCLRHRARRLSSRGLWSRRGRFLALFGGCALLASCKETDVSPTGRTTAEAVEPTQPRVVPKEWADPLALKGAEDWIATDSPCPRNGLHCQWSLRDEGFPYGVVDTTKQVVEAPEQHCSQAIAATPGAEACWVQTDLNDPVVEAHFWDRPLLHRQKAFSRHRREPP